MSRLWVRVVLFLSSYAPLSAVFCSLYWEKSRVFACASLGVGIIGVAGLLLYLRLCSRNAAMPLHVDSIQKRDSEAMSYIVTYIIPFLALPGETRDKAIALAIFFFTVAVIYVNSEMIHVNPVLNLAGYHLSEVTLSGRGVCYIVHRSRHLEGMDIHVVDLAPNVVLEVKER